MQTDIGRGHCRVVETLLKECSHWMRIPQTANPVCIQSELFKCTLEASRSHQRIGESL